MMTMGAEMMGRNDEGVDDDDYHHYFFLFVRSFVHFIRIMTSFQFFLNIKVRVRKNDDVFELRTYA